MHRGSGSAAVPGRALVIGGASWNRNISLSELPGSRPRTMAALGSHEAIGSSGAGKALNLRSLGWDVTLWARLGDDESGRRVRDRLAARGVEALVDGDPAGTMEHVNLMDPDGGRISIFATTGSLDRPVSSEWISRLVRLAGATDVVAVTIFEHCRAVLHPLREAGVELWVDVHDYDGVAPYHRDFVEAATYLQVSSTSLPAWREFARGRVDAGTRVVICTHGAAGASVLTTEGWNDVAAVPDAVVVDANGAGDAFFAGFATGWARSRPVGECGRRGAILAAAALATPELAPAVAPFELLATP